MNTEILKYLNILLPTHKCVVMPNLGAFIINLEEATINKDRITPPYYTLAFNPELKYNDGIIASHFSKDCNITYNAALEKIKDAVILIKADLKAGKSILCGNIGTLSLNDEGKILFSANKSYLYPDFLGLKQTNIKKIDSIKISHKKDRQRNSIRYITTGLAAASIALLLFVTPSTSIKDNKIQNADFISTVTSSLSIANSKKDAQVQESEIKNISTRSYYIVIGGESAENRASILLKKIQESDFPNAAIINSNDRFRIYVASFDDKQEAENYLKSFRSNNSKYTSAWLYSKKN
ncbi:SPOR domain-containing protein [Dysgonomonas sp. BGC7]|uniref:HU domain-containing protein n=1 Tax=Dysgonomonas sp. BGC7 TaxID=1658008 RepID=UPI0006804554|nr:SPOR domain-containing protein [Dysgonomonas sp. BGC7]MBD8389753.1 SPOR domain-containing protein [Dysgonomonas sp. BGC7]